MPETTGGDQPPAVLSKLDFTNAMLRALHERSPGQAFGAPEELRIVHSEGEFHLVNAYKRYLADPSALATVLADYAGGLAASIAPRGVSRDQLVARIWSKRLVDEVGKDFIFEPVNEELCVVYEVDLPQVIRTAASADLEELGLDRASCRSVALDNLRRIFAGAAFEYVVSPAPDGGMCSVGAVGNAAHFVSALPLLDDFWNARNEPFATLIRGEFVAFLPCRRWMIVTGSNSTKALDSARKLALVNFTQDPHPISPSAFVRRDGRWVKFNLQDA